MGLLRPDEFEQTRDLQGEKDLDAARGEEGCHCDGTLQPRRPEAIQSTQEAVLLASTR